MLKRVCQLSDEGAADRAPTLDHAALAPLRTLDGFGALGAPPAAAMPIGLDFQGHANAEHPPGFYGGPGGLTAIQTLANDDALKAFDFSQYKLSPGPLARQGAAIDLRPSLLTLIFLGLLVDWLALLKLSGRLRLSTGASILGAVLVLGVSIFAHPACADAHITASALTTRLAYVVSGDSRTDETSRSGLESLSHTLDARTSFSPGEPVGVDVARDELAFYPMLYWPINAAAPRPDPKTVARVAAYMKQGGTIVFDTRDALTARANATPTPEALWLRELAKGLDIPELEIVPRDHVITKTFYLLDNFVGRYANGDTWVEALPPEPAGDAPRPVRATDNVSAIVITSNDLAAAWAADKSGRPLFPLTPGGPRQREMALRGGVNLVMYTLTGNYKSDQYMCAICCNGWASERHDRSDVVLLAAAAVAGFRAAGRRGAGRARLRRSRWTEGRGLAGAGAGAAARGADRAGAGARTPRAAKKHRRGGARPQRERDARRPPVAG